MFFWFYLCLKCWNFMWLCGVMNLLIVFVWFEINYFNVFWMFWLGGRVFGVFLFWSIGNLCRNESFCCYFMFCRNIIVLFYCVKKICFILCCLENLLSSIGFLFMKLIFELWFCCFFVFKCDMGLLDFFILCF